MSLDQLPIDSVLPDIVEALRHASSVVIQAPPGAGKTTRVPGALLDAGLVSGRLVMLEPRRLAARSVARRIAYERGSALGDSVGYQVRYDKKWGRKSELVVVTEGILGRWLQSDPFLEGIGCVVLDEFHERSIHTDLALGFLREVQSVRDDLKLVVMSATLGVDAVADFLSAPIVKSEGRTFPLTIRNVSREPEDISRGAANAVLDMIADPEDDGGDILVFMPGAREIRDTVEALKNAGLADVDIRTLYGGLSADEQDAAIQTGPRRRIVVSTNIAETSLTIEGVTSVVDSGLVKRLYASPSSGFDELRVEPVSHASATQRAGRAGRVAKGRAVRLWPAHREFRMSEFEVPDVSRVDLTAAVLSVIAWSGRDPREFAWFDAPSEARISRAVTLLRGLGAIDDVWAVTPLGTRLLELPLHPRLGAVLEAGRRAGCGTLMARCCAIVSEGDFVTRVDKDTPPADSDLLLRAEILESVASNNTSIARRQGLGVDVGKARRISRVARELSRYIDAEPDTVPSRRVLLEACAAGFPDRICFRKAENWAVAGGDSVVLAHQSLVRDADVVVAVEIFGKNRRGEGIVRMASRLEKSWLPALFPSMTSTAIDVEFDATSEKVQAIKRMRFSGVTYDEAPTSIDGLGRDAEVAEKLADAAAEHVERAFKLTKDELHWLERVRFLRGVRPDLGLPDPDFESREVLAQICWGKRSFAELRRMSLVSALQSYLQADARRELDRLAPARLEVPSGSLIKIDYSGEVPVLAVRMQEIFGWRDTPELGGVPVLLHLLAPNYRPAQVTQDLTSFWENTYPQVRKELRARYPKHPWPEDPHSARAIRK